MEGAPPPKPAEGPHEQHRAFVNAPFQLKVETYEDFAKLLPSLGQEATSRASVEEELRKLNIDPKIFYKSRQPLKVSQYTPEDFGFEPETEDLPPLPAGFHPPARSAEDARDNEGKTPMKWTISPAINSVLGVQANDGADDQPQAEATPARARDPECDEIALESHAETCGGRLGHETPEGLSSKLQIDSLTEDGDETEFRDELLKAPSGDEEDAVEAFSLDPEFDYDNPPEGMSGKIDPNDLRLLREVMRVSPRSPPRESQEDVAEDAVHEP